MNETLSWFTRTMHANETLVIPTVSGGINRLQAIITLCNRERERERENQRNARMDREIPNVQPFQRKIP